MNHFNIDMLGRCNQGFLAFKGHLYLTCVSPVFNTGILAIVKPTFLFYSV